MPRAGQLENGAKTVAVFKTAVFKIHNPSQRKRAMLISAMKNAHLCYDRLLRTHFPDAVGIKQLLAHNKHDRRVALANLRVRLCKQARTWRHLGNAAKDAIAADALAQISSYIELYDVQENVGAPTVSRINSRDTEYDAALKRIVTSADAMEIPELASELARVVKMGTLRPLNFPRVRKKDGFVLLRNPESGRLYCWLNLHPETSKFASKTAVENLADCRTGELVSFASKTGALLGLEFGHDYHDAGFAQRGAPKSARLVWRRHRDGVAGGEFELHVAFEFNAVAMKPTTWLGVDRGIYNLAAYVVTDGDGREIETGVTEGRQLRHVQRQFERRTAQAQQEGHVVRGGKRVAWADEAVHVTANEIVALATAHQAQVVMEDLASFSAIGKKKRVIGRRRGGFNRLLNRKQYEKLRKVIEYKLAAAGLPKPLDIGAARTSQTCPECSHWAKENRVKTKAADGFDMDQFACVQCEYKADADVNAARIIAMKGTWFRQLPKKSERAAGPLAHELQFEVYLKRCAARRKGP